MSEQLLLDTNVLIWTLSESDRISAQAKRAMSRSASHLFVSVISVWEMILKHQAGKLDLQAPMEDVINQILYQSQWQILPVRTGHMVPLLSLPMIHKDPFDRMLIAQARLEGMALVTSDKTIAEYNLKIIW